MGRVGVVLAQFPARLQLDQRQLVRQVAVDLVGRAEHERGVGAVAPARLEQVERAGRVDGEVDLRVARRPVVGRLRRAVGDQLDRLALGREQRVDRVAVANVDLEPAKALDLGAQPLRDGTRRRRGAEELRAHVVFEADHVEPRLGKLPDRLRSDQPARSRHYRYRHLDLTQRGYDKRRGPSPAAFAVIFRARAHRDRLRLPLPEHGRRH